MFTSCDKTDLSLSDEVANFTDEAMYSLQESGSIGPSGCYELVFPVTLEFPDGTTAEVNDYDEMRDLLKDWKQNNMGVKDHPVFVFPIEMISEDGETITVASRDELIELKKACPGDFGKFGPKWKHHKCKPCFKLVFPVTIQFPDSTTLEVNDRKELKMALREWKINNPGADEHPTLVFPLDVEMKDGTIVTVNSVEELKELRKSCKDG
ncbi:MAG: hypothetical protein D6714_00330 [Bacteroidetes bacterium]|nr:MAG: hypothetical protein D6714_00330 [Bacteroidota bacterium]